MTLDNSREALEVARMHPGMVSAAAGWHPWLVRSPMDERTLADFRALILENRECIWTVGEIGLDYSEAYVGQQEAQQSVFRGFVRLAVELGLPMTIHVRGPAHDDAARILRDERTQDLKGCLHGFDGTEAEANRYFELGLFVAGGRSLLSGSEELREVFRALPLDRMLVETDGGYRPEREINPGPDMVRDVAQALAAIKQLSLDEVEQQTTRNFEALTGRSLIVE
jgi:TatD DNase family protein